MSYVNQQGYTPQQTHLPHGWEMMIDQRTGYPFYVDHINKTTSWAHPTKQQVHQPQMPQPNQQVPIHHGGSQQYDMPHPQQGYQQQQSYSQSSASQGVEIPIQRVNSPARQPRNQASQRQGAGSPQQSKNKPSQKVYTSKAEIPVRMQQPERPKSAEPNKIPVPGQQETNRAGSAEPRSAADQTLDKIRSVLVEVEQMDKDINKFQGTSQDRQYKYFEEMLTRSLIKLDDIDSQGRDDIRNERKGAVKKIQATLDLLELKAMSNAGPSTNQSESNTNQGESSEYNNSVANKSSSAACNAMEVDTPGNNQDAKQPESVKPQQQPPYNANQNQNNSIFSGNPAPVKDLVLDSEVQC